jgi:hypothetical protein
MTVHVVAKISNISEWINYEHGKLLEGCQKHNW